MFVLDGEKDFAFLARIFHKLLINFTRWTNNKDSGGNNLFEGGFMSLDNIAPLDRSKLPESVGTIEQADSTAWMADYSPDLLQIALRLTDQDISCEDVASKFLEHLLTIAAAANSSGMWHADAFFYDILHLADGRDVSLKVRSLVGLMPVVASLIYSDERLHSLPCFRDRLLWVLRNTPEFAQFVHVSPERETTLLAPLPPERLTRMLTNVFDESGMLSGHGIRGISAWRRDHPFTVDERRPSAPAGQRIGCGRAPLYAPRQHCSDRVLPRSQGHRLPEDAFHQRLLRSEREVGVSDGHHPDARQVG